MAKSQACKTCRQPVCKDCGKALRLHKKELRKKRLTYQNAEVLRSAKKP